MPFKTMSAYTESWKSEIHSNWDIATGGVKRSTLKNVFDPRMITLSNKQTSHFVYIEDARTVH